MFVVNEDLSIYATRGDIVHLFVTAEDDGTAYMFQPGDVVRIKVFGKKDCETVVLQKDFPVTAETEAVEIILDEKDTKIGGVISKPVDYWYEIELNPLSDPQTIIGYDEDGARVFRLYPEGRDISEGDPIITPQIIPFVDKELDLTSQRPIENQAVARAVEQLKGRVQSSHTNITRIDEELSLERARINNIIAPNESANKVYNLAYVNSISSAMRDKIEATITTNGINANVSVTMREANIFAGGTGLEVFIIPNECRPFGAGTFHSADGLNYTITYDISADSYRLLIAAQNGVINAPSSAGVVTMSYALYDYEAKDIRVGADGTIYASAGESVRKQFSLVEKELHSYLTTGKNLVDISKVTYGTRLYSSGELGAHQSYAVTDFIACDGFASYYVASNYNGSACFYDAEKNYISGYDNILYSNGRKIPKDAKYLRTSWGDGNIEAYMQNVTLVVSEKQIVDTPTYDEYGKRMSEDVIVKDKRIFVGEEVTNAGKKNHTISIGEGACRNTVSAPIAIGTEALASLVESTEDNDAGKYSVAIGHQCMQRTTTGDHNTGIGWGCMADNKTGCGNTAVGEDALCHSIEGDSNTCIGNRAYQTGKGSRNTAIGATAMYEDSDKTPYGDANVAVGYGSGLAEGEGDNNTAIGTYAKHINKDSRYSVAIGAMAKTTKSRQVVIGSTESGTPHPLETVLNGDIVVCGTDMVFRKLLFNKDGTISWIDVSSAYNK